MMLRPVVAFAAFASALASTAHAADTKICLEASQSGQDARDAGKLIESRKHFIACGDASCPQPVPSYCAEWLKEVNRRVPSLVFRVTDAAGHDVTDATTTIDGVVVGTELSGRPIEVNPGPHRVRFDRGEAHVEETIVAAESEKGRVITLKLGAAAAPPPPVARSESTPRSVGATARPVPLASFIAWGVGGAALIGFGVFGLKARSDFDDYKATCGSRCTDAERDSVKSSVLLADVFLVTSIVAATVGTVVYLTRPKAGGAALQGALRW